MRGRREAPHGRRLSGRRTRRSRTRPRAPWRTTDRTAGSALGVRCIPGSWGAGGEPRWMTSPDADPDVAHRAFDVEGGGAGTDGHFLTARSGDGVLAALVVDRDLAHRGARGDLHAGLLVEAEADRAHLAAHLARAGVDAAAGGHASGLRNHVDRPTEVVDVAAAGLHLGGDGPMDAIHPQAARLHAGDQRQVRVHADLQAAAGLEVETVDLDASPG